MFQGFKAQLERNLRQAGGQHSGRCFELTHADEQFDQVKARIVIVGVGFKRLHQFGLGSL